MVFWGVTGSAEPARPLRVMLHSPGCGVGSNTFDPYGSYARFPSGVPSMCVRFPSDEPCVVGADLDRPPVTPG